MKLIKYIFLFILLFNNITLELKGDKMKIISNAFENGKEIPKKFTCEGENISPELRWENVPPKTKSLVLICEDPDAPIAEPWIHWIVFNIPPTITSFKEGQTTKSIPGAQCGKGNGNTKKYEGPCPPHGHGVHRYFFRLYALDKILDLEEGVIKKDLLNAMNGHIIAQADLIGKFERK